MPKINGKIYYNNVTGNAYVTNGVFRFPISNPFGNRAHTWVKYE